MAKISSDFSNMFSQLSGQENSENKEKRNGVKRGK
jgi:hypothetical protein